ncbi:MAG: hypothetical protein WBD95_00975 [Xanthobacteraceae bacterium]
MMTRCRSKGGYENIRGSGHGTFELANSAGFAEPFGGLGATNALDLADLLVPRLTVTARR